MKLRYVFVMTVLALPLSIPAQAHDPREHMGNAERPDCTAIKAMNSSKADKNDPVMQAIMKKCMDDDHHADESESKLNNPKGSGQ